MAHFCCFTSQRYSFSNILVSSAFFNDNHSLILVQVSSTIKNSICLNDNSSDFQHAVGSGADCCFTDFEASGSGAAASSYHTRLNSEMFIASQRNSDSEMLDDHIKDVDRKSLDLIEDGFYFSSTLKGCMQLQ
jgi:hypothetical protein